MPGGRVSIHDTEEHLYFPGGTMKLLMTLLKGLVATALVVGKDDKAELRTLAADHTVGDKWLVTDGLKPGDRLIVEGLGRIKPGDTVRPVPAGSPPPDRPKS